MQYASIRDVRAYNRWYPIKIANEAVERVGDNVFKTSRRPLVDGDMDSEVLDDIEVRVDGDVVEVIGVDAELGEITLAAPPPHGSTVEATYYWHPVGDAEIELAIKTASAEIEATTGMRFTQHTRTERIMITSGNEASTSHPIIAVNQLKIYNQRGELIDENPEYDIVDREQGVIRLRRYQAGAARPPWYLPSIIQVEISYEAGFVEVPEQVRQACIILASYWLLVRIAGQLVYGEDYAGSVSIGFRTDELTARINSLRREVEKVIERLPRRVERV